MILSKHHEGVKQLDRRESRHFGPHRNTLRYTDAMADFTVAVITDEFSQDYELVCQTAAELGIRAIEVRTIWNKNVVDLSDDEIREVGLIARAAKLEIICVASPLYKCTLTDSGDLDHNVQQDAFHSVHTFEDQDWVLRRSLEVAGILGARLVRAFSFWRTTEPQNITDRVIEMLRQAVDMAASQGRTIALENEHACNVATASESVPILRAIDHPNFGLAWDPANAYVAGELPYPDGYRLLPAGRIVHVHAKDCSIEISTDRATWKELGKGEIDWPGTLTALAADGYRGAVSLETHWGGPGGDKFEGSRICSHALKRLVAAVT